MNDHPFGRLLRPALVIRARLPGSADEAAAIRDSGLFDSVWYTERNPAARSTDPVTHYISIGGGHGSAPHPLFDCNWYREANPDFPASGLSALGHFVLYGEAAGATPHPLFDPAWYRQQDPTLRHMQTGVFRHFLHEGALRGLSPHPAFDPAYYCAARPDIAAGRINPLTHFVEVGSAQGASPNPLFDLQWYVARNDDVAALGVNPLVHFLRLGAAEGRSPHPHIELELYQAANPRCPREPAAAYLYLVSHETAKSLSTFRHRSVADLHQRLSKAGLFDSDTYLKLNEELRASTVEPHDHFVKYGLSEGRPFTSAEGVARLLSSIAPTVQSAQAAFADATDRALANSEAADLAVWFRTKGIRIGIFSSSAGNFYMREIAELLAWGLQALGIRADLRDERAARDEPFDLRIFVAPHEFFILGKGRAWQGMAGASNSALYNVEQVQTQWFCRTFQILMKAPLLFDINFQSAEILRHLGCNVVHYMPGHLPSTPYTIPQEDVSDIDIAQGYGFSQRRLNWMERDSLNDRPIDILFVGASSPRRDATMERLLELSDDYRFLCVYRGISAPLTVGEHRATSGRINCALAQRAKIVLNIHRDWVGYFEWSRIVLLGFWQGACVVSDPSLANPLFQAGLHYHEESTRHLRELIRWLLSTQDGRATLETTRKAGFARASGIGASSVALAPVLSALRNLLEP
jgi:hypothetical protein